MDSILSMQAGASKRYRSVKYQSIRADSLNSTQEHKIKLVKPFRLPSTTKNSFNRTKRNHTENSTQAKFRHSRSQFASLKTESPEETSASCSYLGSFYQLLGMQRNRRNSKPTTKGSDNNNSSPSNKMECIRVQLPILHQVESNFTVLDNVNLPISYLNEQITRIQQQMKVQSSIVSQLGQAITELGQTYTEKLNDIEERGKYGFEKLRGLLKMSRVSQQESNLKLKRLFNEAKDYLPEYYQSLENSKQRCRQLQTVVFSNCPYELEQMKEFQMLSHPYF